MTRKRTPLIAGNWKMHKGAAESRAFVSALLAKVGTFRDREAAVFPPFTSLPVVAEILRGLPFSLGAQNMHWEDSGAFTGEVSPLFLKELGCRYVLAGHSERRAMFGETDGTCHRKVTAALAAGIVPVLCCGETLAEQKAGETSAVLERQLGGALAGLSAESELVIAYEPVWAIGTGLTAAPQQAVAAHAHIRAWLSSNLSPTAAVRTRILYGGSVNTSNIDSLMASREIDGVLVGGASLDPAGFARIVGYASG